MTASDLFTGNVLAAFGDRLSELLNQAAEAATGFRRESQALLVTLAHEPQMGPTQLATTLHVTVPSVVHLLNRLERTGHLVRRPGVDGRRTSVHLTAEGRAAASAVLAARREVVLGTLASVDEVDRPGLHSALVSMVQAMTDRRATGDHICRRCDEEACPDGACPVECALGSAHRDF